MRRTTGAAVAAGAALTLLAATGAHAEGRGDIRVTKTVVDKGTSVIVGTSNTVRFPVELTIKDDSGVQGVSRVSTYNTGRHGESGVAEMDGRATCVEKSRTTSVCTQMMKIVPRYMPGYSDRDANLAAGAWTVNATVKAEDGDYWIADGIASFKVKRAATLVTDASPEPVRKGGRLTVTGKLTRAHWEDLKYYGFTGQTVKLQFRKAGATSYSTVRTVKTGSGGKLSATLTANAAGAWRWHFDGTTTTMRVTAKGDTVALG